MGYYKTFYELLYRDNIVYLWRYLYGWTGLLLWGGPEGGGAAPGPQKEAHQLPAGQVSWQYLEYVPSFFNINILSKR